MNLIETMCLIKAYEIAGTHQNRDGSAQEIFMIKMVRSVANDFDYAQRDLLIQISRDPNNPDLGKLYAELVKLNNDAGDLRTLSGAKVWVEKHLNHLFPYKFHDYR